MIFIKVIFSVIFGFVSGAVGLFEYINYKEIQNIPVYTSGDISFHFLELGNENTGDCTFIQVGEIDILIDAGSKVDSIPTISAYVNNHISDNKLEYVIVTHAHEDHYAGFATNESTESLFDMYEVGVVIDFSQITTSKATSKMYLNYQRELSEAVSKGAVHYTAKDLFEGQIKDSNNEVVDNVFNLSDSCSMTILNQKYYYEKSSTENDHSVCTLFTHEKRNFLFTGDLEKDGEESLVELNSLPHCDLYKAGHHGSKTSSHNVLLDVITPKIVTVCCCAGNVEYTQNLSNTFPTQDFINRISKHTKQVYVTTLGSIKYNSDKQKYENNGYQSMNGNIKVWSDNEGVFVKCSNNDTLLKDTTWFKENRDCPSYWAS